MPLKKLFGFLKLQRVTSASTFVNVSTLMSGTVLSTVIPIIFSPVMSRIFTPQDFGIIGLYVSITTILGVIAYSHYQNAILLAATNDEAKQIIWFTLLIIAIVSLGIFLLISALYFFSVSIMHSSVGLWYFFMPLSVFLNGINATLIIWGNRIQKYKILASNRVVQAVFTVAIQIGIGIFINNETGLMVGLLVGQIVSAFLLAKVFLLNQTISIGIPHSREFKGIAIRYKSLLLFSTPAELINALINQTPFFLLQKFSGIASVGSYAFTQRLLGLPQVFISSAIGDVFKQKASVSYHAEGNCRSMFVKTFMSLALIGFFPFVILILFAPTLIVFVFGEQWHEAGVFTQILGIMFYFRFVISPLTYVYFIAGKLKENFLLHVLFLIAVIIAFYAGHYFFGSSIMMILFFSITYSLIYLVYLVRSYKFSCS